MATVYTHMPMERRIVSYGQQRIYELKEIVSKAKTEMEMWEHLIEDHGLCKTCHGETKTLHQILQDESEWETCITCKGSGKRT